MNKITMKKNQEPAVLFEQISAVENRYNSAAGNQVSKEDLIAVILDAAPAGRIPSGVDQRTAVQG
jgi:hypothetical protein